MAARSKIACVSRSRCTKRYALYGRTRSRLACASPPPIGSKAAGRRRKPSCLAKELKKRGLDYMDVSTGGLDPAQKIPLAPGYQVPFSDMVKKETGLTTMSVGLIAGFQQAEDIVASGKADFVCLARGAMWDRRWAWHAAEELGAETPYAPKMMACHPKLRPQLFPKRAEGMR